MKKIIMAVLTVGVGAALIVGCGSEDEAPTAEQYRAALEEYKSSHRVDLDVRKLTDVYNGLSEQEKWARYNQIKK